MEVPSVEQKLLELEARLQQGESERDQYRKLYELTSLELEPIRRHLFGKKAETVDERQVQLAFDNLDPAERATLLSTVRAESARQGKKKPNQKPSGRKPLPETLPVEHIELPPPVSADAPEKPIAKCKAGVGMLAHVLVSKHADHLPLNRQVKIMDRHEHRPHSVSLH